MQLRWFAFPVLALAGLGVAGLALAGFVVLVAYRTYPRSRRLPRTSRIPCESIPPTASDRRIRRGAALAREHRGGSRPDETGDPRRRRRVSISTGVDYHGVLRAATQPLAGGKTQGRYDHHAGRAPSSFRARDLTRKLYEACWRSRSRIAWARIKSSRYTSTRSTSASGPTDSEPRPRSTLARRCPS